MTVCRRPTIALFESEVISAYLESCFLKTRTVIPPSLMSEPCSNLQL